MSRIPAEKSCATLKKRVDSDSKSIIEASSVQMNSVKEMHGDVTHMETVEIPDEFFEKTFVRYLIFGTAEARKENVLVDGFHENFAEFRFEGNRYKGGRGIYTYGAMKYLTNLKNHLTVNLERFIVRAAFALYPGISRKGIWAMINGITRDRKNQGEVEFVDK